MPFRLGLDQEMLFLLFFNEYVSNIYVHVLSRCQRLDFAPGAYIPLFLDHERTYHEWTRQGATPCEKIKQQNFVIFPLNLIDM